MKRLLLLTFLSSILLTLVSCSIFFPEEPTPTPSPRPSPTLPGPITPRPTAPPNAPTAAPPTVIPRADLGQTRVYRDNITGFELDIPSHWSLTPVDNQAMVNSVIYTATFHSWTPIGGGSEGVPAGETKIDITVIKNNPADADAALELRKQEFANAGLNQEILSEETWTLDNNLLAARLVVSGNQGESAEIVTAINGSTIVLSGVGDYALFDAIARTLRQIPTS